MARAIIRTIKRYAPDAYAGLLASHWTISGIPGWNVDGVTHSSWDAVTHSAQANAQFMQKLIGDGADRGDFIGVEKNGYSAGHWRVHDNLDRYYWTDEGMRKFLHWSKTLGQMLDMPVVGWQISIGHMGLPNKCEILHCDCAYEDTFFPFFFKYPKAFVDAGFIGFLVGKGLADDTDYTLASEGAVGDRGWFFNQLAMFDRSRPYLKVINFAQKGVDTNKLLLVGNRDNYLTRCGTGWGDANSKCQKTCLSDKDCPNGQKCFKDLTPIPCTSRQSRPKQAEANIEANSKPSSIRCGEGWTSANDKCGAACSTDADCKLPARCFKSLSTAPCYVLRAKVPLLGPVPVCTGNAAVDTLLYQARIKDIAQISSSNVYDWDGFCKATRLIKQAGLPLLLGGVGQEAVGAVNIASLLAQCMWESGGDAPFTACDENNYKRTATAACTQRDDGQLYHLLVSATSCKVDAQMRMKAETFASWTPGPLECVPGTVTEKCCWWGRGAIQTTGPHNYGELQRNIIAKIPELKGVDVCVNPEAICQRKELKWIGALYYWTSVVQKDPNFSVSIGRYVSSGFNLVASKVGGADFASGCGGSVNNGRWAVKAHGDGNRLANFKRIIDAFRKVSTFKSSKIDLTAVSESAQAGSRSLTGGSVRCGKTWGDANSRCGTSCNSNSDCPSSEQCFKDMSPGACNGIDGSGTKISAKSTASTIRCGISWIDANQKCDVACIKDNDCADNQKCFAQLTLSPCSSKLEVPSNNMKGTIRCGKSWGEANIRCGKKCAIDSDCPTHEKCFAQLTLCGGMSPRTNSADYIVSPSRCGLTWSRANQICGATCEIDDDCKIKGESCWGKLDTKVCIAEKSSSGGTTRCGYSWAEASKTCGITCSNNEDCGKGKQCFADLDAGSCSSHHNPAIARALAPVFSFEPILKPCTQCQHGSKGYCKDALGTCYNVAANGKCWSGTKPCLSCSSVADINRDSSKLNKVVLGYFTNWVGLHLHLILCRNWRQNCAMLL